MSLPQNLGRLSAALTSDASLNIGVGVTPSGSFKLEVGTTSKFTGVATFGSTLSNGTYSYTLPGATGTLALTSDLSGYVTLATSQTISGEKTFSAIRTNINGSLVVKSGAATGVFIESFTANYLSLGVTSGVTTYTQNLIFPASSANSYTFPSATGTLALTSALSSYLPLSGGTLTGALSGTSATFSGNGAFNTTSAVSNYSLDIRAATNKRVGVANSNSLSGANLLFYTDANAFADGYIDATKLILQSNSGGNVGIGTTSPSDFLEVVGAGSKGITISAATDISPRLLFNTVSVDRAKIVGSSDGLILSTLASTPIIFSTNATERMRITSGGYLKLREATSSTTEVHILRADTTTDAVVQVNNSNNSQASDGLLSVVATRNTTNNTFYAIGYYNVGAGAWKLRVADSGNVTNTNGSYGAISDIKLKENIIDATPKLDDLLKVKIRNFNYIGNEEKQLGVIAQELEEVFPRMIEQHNDYKEVEVTDKKGNTTTEKQSLGTVTKSVKYSIFVPMLIKAMQELAEQVKELKAEIDLLKGKPIIPTDNNLE